MQELIDFMVNIPQTIVSFGSWLVEPLDVIGLSPLGLLGIAGVSAVIMIIGIHIVRLFVG